MDTSDENLSKLFKIYSHLLTVASSGNEREKAYALNAELPKLRNSISAGLGELLGLSSLENSLKGISYDPN